MSDLVERCKELLEWSATGLLHGGSGGSIRDLAAGLEAQGIPEYQAMAVAEHQTKHEAMTEVVRLTEQLVKAKAALEIIYKADTTVTDGGKVHDLGPCAEIATATLCALSDDPDADLPTAQDVRGILAKTDELGKD